MSKTNENCEDISEVFKAFARTNLTESMRKGGTLGRNGAAEIEAIIKNLRENKMDIYPTWGSSKFKWWDAVTTGSMHDMLQLLKEDPSIVNWKNPIDGWTALHYVAKSGNLKCLDVLVKQYGANVDAKNSSGATPLHIAVMFQQQLFARYLVQVYNARNDIEDYSGRYPCDLLSTPQMKEDLEELLTEGRLSIVRKKLEVLRKQHKNSMVRLRDTLGFASVEDCASKVASTATVASASAAASSAVPIRRGPPSTSGTDSYTLLLLSSLSSSRNNAGDDESRVSFADMARLLRHSTTPNYTAENLLGEMYKQEQQAPPTTTATGRRHHCKQQKSSSLKRGSVMFSLEGGEAFQEYQNREEGAASRRGSTLLFKMPHLPHSGKGGRRVKGKENQEAAGGMGSLLRRRKHSLSTLAPIPGSGPVEAMASGLERHSIAGTELERMRAEAAASTKVTESGEADKNVARQSSNASDNVTKSSSDDYPLFDSASSSLSANGGMERSLSVSSLVACTENLFSQYFPTVAKSGDQ